MALPALEAPRKLSRASSHSWLPCTKSNNRFCSAASGIGRSLSKGWQGSLLRTFFWGGCDGRPYAGSPSRFGVPSSDGNGGGGVDMLFSKTTGQCIFLQVLEGQKIRRTRNVFRPPTYAVLWHRHESSKVCHDNALLPRLYCSWNGDSGVFSL